MQHPSNFSPVYSEEEVSDFLAEVNLKLQNKIFKDSYKLTYLEEIIRSAQYYAYCEGKEGR